jgi:hypothetical protein
MKPNPFGLPQLQKHNFSHQQLNLANRNFIKTLLLSFILPLGLSCNKDDSPLSGDAEVVSFEIMGVAGTITGDQISLTLPYSTNTKSLTATTTLSTNASISPDPGIPVDYTNGQTFTVTAADGSTTKTYTVTVSLETVKPTAENPYPEGLFILKNDSPKDILEQSLHFIYPDGTEVEDIFKKVNTNTSLENTTAIIPHSKGYLMILNKQDNSGGQLRFADLKMKITKTIEIPKASVTDNRFVQIGNTIYYSNISTYIEYNQPKNKAYAINLDKQTVKEFSNIQAITFLKSSNNQLYFTDVANGLYLVNDLSNLENNTHIADLNDQVENDFVIDSEDRIWGVYRDRFPKTFQDILNLGYGRYDYHLKLSCFDLSGNKTINSEHKLTINTHVSPIAHPTSGGIILVSNQNDHLQNAKKSLYHYSIKNDALNVQKLQELKKGSTFEKEIKLLPTNTNKCISVGENYYFELNYEAQTEGNKSMDDFANLFYRKAL